ncbi:MAG: addiction module protein [Ignavibacteria bacterium]|nr:addiction module protein [Ignavibacteria bacterium]
MTVQNIEKQLMRLDANSRAKLASILLSSLDDLSDAENETLWAAEAFRRHNALVKGRAKSIPVDIVFKNARARLK